MFSTSALGLNDDEGLIDYRGPTGLNGYEGLIDYRAKRDRIPKLNVSSCSAFPYRSEQSKNRSKMKFLFSSKTAEIYFISMSRTFQMPFH